MSRLNLHFLNTFIFIVLSTCSTLASPALVSIKTGTLIWNPTKNVVTFKLDTGETVFYDLSPKKYLEVSGVKSPGVPGLTLAGFINNEGAFFAQGDPRIISFSNISSIVLRDENDVKYKIDAVKQKPFICVVIKLSEKETVTLWQESQ